MIAYYELSKNIYDHLIADEDLNTVIIGDTDLIDTNKQTMFPLAHILIGEATPKGGIIDFSVTVTAMDIVDINKEDPTFSWKGEENKQYILNTMLAVLENLDRSIDKGAMFDLGWELLGDPVATPFEDQNENLLTGWSMTFNVSIPNTTQKCVVNNAIKFISANKEYISSPDAQYLPDTIAELDIEIDFEPISEGDILEIIGIGLSTSANIFNLLKSTDENSIGLVLRTNNITQNFTSAILTETITGNLKIKGNGTNLEVYLNDVLIVNDLVTISQDLTGIVDNLYFGAIRAFGTVFAYGNLAISKVKLNNHIWTFSEGSGSTTTNSQGVISTLNSDVSVNNMWIRA